LARWFVFLTVFALGAGGLAGCGSLTRGEKSGLAVSLEIPAGEDPALFWYGVTQKTLRVSAEGDEPTVLPWEEGRAPEVELREGDKLEFFGNDEQGRLLVTGETTVGGEKKAAIPVRRVL
jgi:hypothetical protein